jgi:citrate synthase
VLRTIRSDKQFTADEARLLDILLILHADHGGGNNSTFATRVLTSAGTDSYSALSAGIGSLKGPLHGGASVACSRMLEYMLADIANITDEGQVADFLAKLLKGEAGDRSGKIYGMGHAVYTLSDPRAEILKRYARDIAQRSPYAAHFALLETVERLTPEVFKRVKGKEKVLCANVDLYSGLIYRVLQIPEDLFTPVFALARTAGWCAHRLEELQTGGRIIRPAYKSVAGRQSYVPLSGREKTA